VLLGVALVFIVAFTLGWSPVVEPMLSPATMTPYLPIAPTMTRPAGQIPQVNPQDPPPNRTGEIWQGLDLRDESPRIELDLQPAAETVNRGRAISIVVRPGRPCEYQDRRACITHFADAKGRVILVTVHSGVGGAAQAFRHALEGTGINRASYSLEKIQANMEALQGAAVSARQNDTVMDLRVLAVERIPPLRLAEYFGGPVTPFIEQMGDSHPMLRQALDAGEAVMVIETCGWRHPAEREESLATDTTGSIYLLVVGK
jgi:hypothetical protein